MTNSNTSNKSLSRISSGDHKRTQQRVPTILLFYLYKLHMVHVTNNYFCPNVHASSMSIPYIYYKIAMCCSNHSLEWHLQYADFSKALSWLSSSEDYKRTRQGAFAALLLYLYKYNVVCATTMCLPHVHPLCFYLMSYYSSIYVFLKATMLPTCALTSYS